ncbi:cytidylyltransferase domain-containing protein [Thioalkalivibrio versutus]|uniref:cytidylyltransferase domain-containing protein n=1 Tax=Thioalkalivibrio versutus TaxID=106634 RepID=UPI00117D2A0A|nr:NTP transferase domain-containing protein [Thioalkalivibrio versutus]
MSRFVFVYARSDSSRLPGKPMMTLSGRKVIDIVLERASRVGADEFVLLTSQREVDDVLAAHCTRQGVPVVRGHPTNLVSRSLQAIEETGARFFLRVNGDSPFFEPELARQAMAHTENVQMISNIITRCFPYGVSVEWIEAEFYKTQASFSTEEENEHVTSHLYRHVDPMRVLSLTQSRDDSWLRLALDTPEDYAFLSGEIGESVVSGVPYWDAFDLDHPELSVGFSV